MSNTTTISKLELTISTDDTVLSSKFSAIGNTDIKVVLCSAVGLTLLFLMYTLKVHQ